LTQRIIKRLPKDTSGDSDRLMFLALPPRKLTQATSAAAQARRAGLTRRWTPHA